VRRPGAALPLPAGQHHLERRAHRGRLAGAVDERQRLRRGQRRGRGGEHGVAGLGRGDGAGRGAGAADAAGLREDPRPGRVAGRLAQVHAAGAGRAPGPDERAYRADRLVRVRHQVRDAVADKPGEQHRIRAAGDHRQIGPPPGVVRGARLRRDPVHRAGDPGRPALSDVRRAEAGRRDVGRLRRPGIQAAHPGDTGRGEKRGGARAHPTRAVDPDERRAAARQHGCPAVAVPVGQRGAGQLGADSRPQVVREGRAQAGREVVEHARGGEQADHPVHGVGPDAVGLGGPHHLVGVPRPVEQAHHGRRLAQPGQRAGAARVDADLQRVAVPPQRPQPRLQRWSHASSVSRPTDIRARRLR
jgi:hypothetical protein